MGELLFSSVPGGRLWVGFVFLFWCVAGFVVCGGWGSFSRKMWGVFRTPKIGRRNVSSECCVLVGCMSLATDCC